MNLEPTTEQRILRDNAARFAAQHLPLSRSREWTHEPTGVPPDVWRAVGAQAWPGLLVSCEHGGAGLGAVELGIVMEELGRVMAPGPLASTAALGAPAIDLAGTRALRTSWLPRLVAGEAVATLALLEEDAEVGPSHVRTRAEAVLDGFLLGGVKWFVPDALAADLFVVLARTGHARDALTAFAVEARAPGVRVETHVLSDPSARAGRVVLEGVRVRKDGVLGEVGGGWALVQRLLLLASVARSADAVAGAEAVLESTVAYVRGRTQFGVPVGSFQAVKHPLANLFAQIESARSAYHYAAWAVGSVSSDARPAAAVARLLCTTAYRRAAEDCLQAHGGVGFTWDYDLHRYLRRAVHDQRALGTATDDEDVIAREALGI